VQLALNNIREKIQITVEKRRQIMIFTYRLKITLCDLVYIASQATMDNVLFSLASSSSSCHKFANALGVSRKRVAKAKARRAEFDLIV
jgi:hypothetical protein